MGVQIWYSMIIRSIKQNLIMWGLITKGKHCKGNNTNEGLNGVRSISLSQTNLERTNNMAKVNVTICIKNNTCAWYKNYFCLIFWYTFSTKLLLYKCWYYVYCAITNVEIDIFLINGITYVVDTPIHWGLNIADYWKQYNFI